MRSKRVFHAVDSHTEGMPTRVITGGVGTIPGATMAQRRQWFMENCDDVRTLLMYEPRGHASMSGAILQPPTRPDADYGVLFIEVSGLLPMCGHGTIGVATVLVETGMVSVVEPVTTIRLDTPAGLVIAEVSVVDGAARSVTIRNVPSFSLALDQSVNVQGYGEVHYDMAFGGNFYAIVELAELQLPFERAAKDQLLAGLPSWGPSTRRTAPCTPNGPTSTAATTSTSRPLGPRRPIRAMPWPSIPAGLTGLPAAPEQAPAWRNCTPAVNWHWTLTSSTKAILAPGSPAGSWPRPPWADCLPSSPPSQDAPG